MGAVGAGRGLWGHGQGRSPLPCKQFRPPDPRGQERTPPAPWAPLRNQKHREGVGIRRWSPLAPRPRPSRPGPAPRPPRLQPRPPIMAANLWLILGLLASHSSDLEWCQSKPRHLPQLWMMSPVTQAPPHLPLTTAAVREAPPTAVTTPIQNLHIDPAHYTLSWDPAPGADITTGAFCRKGRDIFVWADPGLARCSFQSLSLCHVTNFTVFLGKDRAVAGSIQFPPDDDGDHEAAAQDLRCWVHEGQLSCQWERGPKATGDVHYRMFWRDVRLGPAHNRECPHYHSLDVNTAGPAPHGGHEGCTLDLDTVLGSTPNSPDLVPQVTITVNGSGRAGPVPCMDNTVDLQRAGLHPPLLGPQRWCHLLPGQVEVRGLPSEAQQLERSLGPRLPPRGDACEDSLGDFSGYGAGGRARGSWAPAVVEEVAALPPVPTHSTPAPALGRGDGRVGTSS
ncbi:interleukin-3 receptor subunit alpha isoform X7 [Mus musculus]|uniref:interleukin-3 receptor subunit alpha isoform X7 n=1 Tax=Mus musculus TaxID=10090 RepID=UPI0003D6F31A|nr:interleukin-3 receptor subunit alpha isoform X7 [Mus musculus]|eukprot:XP_017171353.1 PREDICTED: interleukin-3 receptor subunit alpha isoform X6 [Mus musculus]